MNVKKLTDQVTARVKRKGSLPPGPREVIDGTLDVLSMQPPDEVRDLLARRFRTIEKRAGCR